MVREGCGDEENQGKRDKEAQRQEWETVRELAKMSPKHLQGQDKTILLTTQRTSSTAQQNAQGSHSKMEND